MVDQAIATYFRHAYGSEPRRKQTDAGEDVLRAFIDETRPGQHGAEGLGRFTMRLGNRNYPFMKLVLQEHVVPGQFYFTVDTHDHMDIRPDFPDYEAWMRVKRFNLALKRQIEQAFEEAGLPTLGTVCNQVLLEPGECLEGAPLIFVVDDEEEEAYALELVLRQEGYDVALAADGREALDRLRFLRPSLIVLDYEMPELDGLAVIQELRSREATRKLPILLTTASDVLQSERDKADGFLAKPFRSRDLVSLVHHLLGD